MKRLRAPFYGIVTARELERYKRIMEEGSKVKEGQVDWMDTRYDQGWERFWRG